MKDITGKTTLEIMNEAQWYNRWVFSFISPHLRGEILEVGVGIGNFAIMLAQKGNVTAIDIDKGYLQTLKSHLKNVEVGYGNVESGKYFFKNKKFDSIVSLNVVEHIKEDKKALKNMNALLKKGGKLVLLVPAYRLLFSNFDRKLGHYRRYSKNEVKDLVESADAVRALVLAWKNIRCPISNSVIVVTNTCRPLAIISSIAASLDSSSEITWK